MGNGIKPRMWGPQGPGTLAASWELVGILYRRRDAFLISSWSRRSMGMMPMSWWSGLMGVVLKAPAMCQTAAFCAVQSWRRRPA